MKYYLTRLDVETGEHYTLDQIHFSNIQAATIYKRLFTELTGRKYIITTKGL